MDTNRGGRPQPFKDDTFGSASSGNGFDSSQNVAVSFYTLLRAPCLSLLQIYLKAFCGKQSLRTAMSDFRNKHHKIVKCIYVIDQLFDFGLLAIVVFVFLRGLGIVK